MRPALPPLVLAAALLLGASPAPASPPPSEDPHLAHGETIQHRQAFTLHGEHFVGGLTYTAIPASPAELDAIFTDVSAYPRILPYTKAARLVGRDGRDLLVWLRQGNSLLDASYTVRVRPDPAAPNAPHLVRFWLDRSRPHGIEDAWGFFRYEPMAPGASGEPRVLLTYGVWVDVGPGLVRTFFEGRIQQIALTAPQHLRAFVTERHHGA